MDPKTLLDELMGKDRDLPLGQKRKSRLRFDDPEVCHYFLVSFCPHDLFPNTKSDLGPCGKVHDESLRDEFLKSNRVAQYEAEFMRYLERLINDLERKIKRLYDRLEKEAPPVDNTRLNSERIAGIEVEVQLLLKQAERDGEIGLVDLAQATMTRVEILNKEKDNILRTGLSEYGSLLDKEKRMQVCDVCGAMQASTDTEKRLASHLEGRQHMGYLRIRQTLEHLRKKRDDEIEAKRREKEAARPPPVEEMNIPLSPSKDSADAHKNEVERRQDYSDRRSKQRSMSPGRRGRKEKQSSHSHSHNDRDRGRHHNSNRERERERERERDGRRNWRWSGRDYERRRRGRSKERSRSRSRDDEKEKEKEKDNKEV